MLLMIDNYDSFTYNLVQYLGELGEEVLVYRNDEIEVQDIEAVIDASPYNYCQPVITVAKNLIGLRIAPGWTDKSKKAMGSNRGCTHLTELLGPIATTAIQTIVSEKMKRSEGKPQGSSNAFLNSCHSYAADSPVVKLHWPEHYQASNDS